MDSKISFRKVMSEDVRQRIWLIVFFAIIAFLTCPLVTHFYLQNLAHSSSLYNSETIKNLKSDWVLFLLGSSNPWMHIFCVIGGVLSAITGYLFLHSKEKSDFFQSLGIKRWKMYIARWICGWLIFIVPYIVNVLITYYVILPVNGAFDSISAFTVFTTMGMFVLGFTAIYGTCVLACVLTGRIIVALIIIAMIFVYVPICAFTLSRIAAATYDKLYLPAVFSSTGELFSPIGALIRAGLSIERFDSLAISAMIALGVWAAATFVCGCTVYSYRPSEAAGMATSFTIIKPVVKIAFGIAAGLAVGTVVSEIAYYENGERLSVGWFWFWSILTIVLVQIILEAIYNRDIKDIVKHWKSFLIMLGGLIAAAVIIIADPIGANTWFPEKENVAKMGLYDIDYTYSGITGESRKISYGVIDLYFGDFFINYDAENKKLKNMLIDDWEALYEVAKTAHENTSDTFDGQYILGFQLKNGAVKYRVYDIDSTALTDVIYKLSESKEFREKYYPAFNYDFSDMTELYIQPDLDTVRAIEKSLTPEQLSELVESYKSDCVRYSLKEINEIGKHKSLGVMLNDKSIVNNNFYVRLKSKSASITIHPEFTSTIDCLSRLTGENIGEYLK